MSRLFLLIPLLLPGLAVGQTFMGGGPLPVRNYQPIQQIFLNLPFARAQVLAPGRWQFSLESAESNEIATEQGRVEAALKFEQNRTVLGTSLGLRPGLEVGLEVPLISRFGGFMDPVIDSVEDLFGLHNAERSLWRNNTFGDFTVRRDHRLLFHGERQYLELGDLAFSGKYLLWEPVQGPSIALRAGVKAPTGRTSSVFGSGKPDFAFGLASEQRVFSWLVVYSNVALTYPLGPITPQRLSLNPIVTEGVAFEAPLGRGFSLLFQQAMYTSPFHGLEARLLEGTVVDLMLGFNWTSESFLLQLGGIENVSGVAQAADFTLLLRAVWRP